MMCLKKANKIFEFIKNRPKLIYLIQINKFHRTQINNEIISFNLSDIGEGIREVIIREWFVNIGDKVSQFDNICEVQSDKATVTITSRYDGIIKKLYYNIDDIALVGKALVDIETENDREIINQNNQPSQDDDYSGEIINKNDTELILNNTLCIPSVRRLAKEYKVDLKKIKGTGKNNRILKEDVLKHLQINDKDDLQNNLRKIKDENKDEIKSLNNFQKTMMRTMTESLKIPHFLYGDEICITQLSELKSNLKQNENIKLSLMAFFIKAVSNALKKYPILNAKLNGNCDHIIYNKYHNIGVAMDTTVGLAVPVIKNIEKLTIIEINNELLRLMKSGKTGIFSKNDLSEGTFTISNIGSIGGTYMKPIILPPQVAIIAIGSSKFLPRFDSNNKLIMKNIINVSGAGDHRIIDGATMARFVNLFKKQIESPNLLFLNV